MAAPIDYTPAKNASGRPIPAGGAVRVTGIDPDTGAFLVDLPDEDNDPAAGIVGDHMIPAAGAGNVHWGPRAVAAFDGRDGTPAPGEQWGVQAGSYLLRKGLAGFEVLAGSGLGLVNVVRTYREDASGSGSGRSAGSPGSGGVRCTGSVYSTVRYRYVRAGDQLVEVSQLETLAWDSTGCLVATVGDTSSRVIGCAPCPSDEGSKKPTDVFGTCAGTPATLRYEITSDDIPCLNGDVGTVTKSGSTWGPGSTNPCGSDNVLALTCTGDVWTAVYSTTDTVVTLVDQGPDYLLFKLVSAGVGTVPAGTAYISVTAP